MSELFVYQTINIGSIRRFLSRPESVLLFLLLTGVMTVMLVVFGQPTSLTDFTTQDTPLSPLGQIAISFTSGFGALIISRALLLLVGRKVELQPAVIGLWLMLELLLCVAVTTLVLWALSGGGTLQLAPLVGIIVLGFMGTLLVPYAITYLIYRLHETYTELQRIRQFVDPKDTAFSPSMDKNINFYSGNGKLAFTAKISSILYIEAANNYLVIHYISGDKEDTFLLHNTMKNLASCVDGTSLIRCHRSIVVNVQNVKLMRKDGASLVLELNLTPRVLPVSKVYAETMVQYFSANTTIVTPVL